MRVLHLCHRYFPERGGSETYTSALARELMSREVACTMASATQPPGLHYHEGIPVFRLGEDMATVRDSFRRLLDDGVDVVHFHVGASAWSRWVLEATLSKGIPTVLTYHHQGISCLRGNLMRFGLSMCSGQATTRNCLPCRAHQLGLPRFIAGAMLMVPAGVSAAAGSLPVRKVRTALQLPGEVGKASLAIREYLAGFSSVVVLSEWSRKLLLENGVSADRISLCRLGTHHPPPPRKQSREGPVRGIYVGRLDSDKGVPIIVAALRACPGLNLQIDVYGPASGGPIPWAEQDGRLRYRGVLPDREVVDRMSEYDFAFVPTQVPETGPFTVVEALQAGLPVLGSDMPAINELLEHERNSLLVPHNDVGAWAQALSRIVTDIALRHRLGRSAAYPRSMADVSEEMLRLYARLAR